EAQRPGGADEARGRRIDRANVLDRGAAEAALQELDRDGGGARLHQLGADRRVEGEEVVGLGHVRRAFSSSGARRPEAQRASIRRSLQSDQKGWSNVAGRLPSKAPWPSQAGA